VDKHKDQELRQKEEKEKEKRKKRKRWQTSAANGSQRPLADREDAIDMIGQRRQWQCRRNSCFPIIEREERQFQELHSIRQHRD